MGTLTSGLVAFPNAVPDDGQLEVAVITADTWTHWLRVLYRLISGHPERSPLARTTRGAPLTSPSTRRPPTNSTVARGRRRRG